MTMYFTEPLFQCLFILLVVNQVTSKSQHVRTIPIISVPSENGTLKSCPSEYVRESGRTNISISLYNFLPSIAMRLACGEGNWQQVASLDMTDTSQQCPSPWLEYTSIRSCGRPDNTTRNCTATWFSTNGTQYNKVCGRAIGYQIGSTDAFNRQVPQTTGTPDDNYVDGLSVTHGSNPRKHIWTFAVGLNEARDDLAHRYSAPGACPCAAPNSNSSFGVPPPSYVGNNYFCETGNHGRSWGRFHYSDPLWDGQGCVSSDCCTFNSPPWFSVTLPNPTTDDIEARICSDQVWPNFYDEATTVGMLELYIQ